MKPVFWINLIDIFGIVISTMKMEAAVPLKCQHPSTILQICKDAWNVSMKLKETAGTYKLFCT
jgi:hypothetical protein